MVENCNKSVVSPFSSGWTLAENSPFFVGFVTNDGSARWIPNFHHVMMLHYQLASQTMLDIIFLFINTLGLVFLSGSDAPMQVAAGTWVNSLALGELIYDTIIYVLIIMISFYIPIIAISLCNHHAPQCALHTHSASLANPQSIVQ